MQASQTHTFYAKKIQENYSPETKQALKAYFEQYAHKKNKEVVRDFIKQNIPNFMGRGWTKYDISPVRSYFGYKKNRSKFDAIVERHQFSKEERARVHGYIAKLYAEKRTQRAMVAMLNKAGFSRPNGSPCDETFVSNMIYRMNKTGVLKSETTRFIDQPDLVNAEWIAEDKAPPVHIEFPKEAHVAAPAVYGSNQTHQSENVLESVQAVINSNMPYVKKLSLVRMIVKD